MVVPPGDVTISRQLDRVHVLIAEELRRPDMVWTTSSVETSRERPRSIPASIIDSARRAKYAGPEPETAVIASM